MPEEQNPQYGQNEATGAAADKDAWADVRVAVESLTEKLHIATEALYVPTVKSDAEAALPADLVSETASSAEVVSGAAPSADTASEDAISGKVAPDDALPIDASPSGLFSAPQSSRQSVFDAEEVSDDGQEPRSGYIWPGFPAALSEEETAEAKVTALFGAPAHEAAERPDRNADDDSYDDSYDDPDGEAIGEAGGIWGEDMGHTSEFDLPPLTRSIKKPQKESTKKREGVEAWKILLAVLICMLFAMGSYLVGKVYGATLIPDEPMYIGEAEDEDEADSPQEAPSGPQILNILLMGTDQREKNEMARSDTILLLVMNLDTLEVHMVSIPRDTRAIIAGSGENTKINHAHAIGGPECLVETVESLLGVNVHYYVETNFTGFEKCVDILGGVDYNVERRMYFPEEGIDLMPGQQKLNGNKALQYVRWRGDPTADIGRIGRQQKFIKALLEQSVSFATVPKLPGLIGALQENVVTDMSGAQLLQLATRFAVDIGKLSFTSATLPGEAKTVGGAAYWIMDEDAAKELIGSIFNPPEPEPEPEPESATEAEPEADLEAEPEQAPEAQAGQDT